MGNVLRASLVVLGVYVVARLFFFAHVLVFVAFLGVLFGLAVSSGVDRLQRFHIPRGLGAAMIVLGFIALLVGFGAWSGPTVHRQYRELRQRLPEAFVQIDQWLGRQQGGMIGTLFFSNSDSTDSASTPAQQTTSQSTSIRQNSDSISSSDSNSSKTDATSLSHLKSLKNTLLSRMPGAKSYVFPFISSTFAAVAGVILVLFLSIYIAADPELYRRGVLSLIPRSKRRRIEQVMEVAGTSLRKWLLTQLIAMLAIGVVTTVVLLLLGVPAALPLGILAGLLEFVPTVGPVLSAIPSIAMGFTDSPEKAAFVAIAYILIQFMENHLLIPLLMKEGVDLPPVLTILTQATMALVFGFMGLFVAVPMLVLVTVLVRMLYVEAAS